MDLNFNGQVVHTIKPRISPLKQELIDCGISIAVAAKYVGRSYTYLVNQLNGLQTLQPHTEKKLKELIASIREENKKLKRLS